MLSVAGLNTHLAALLDDLTSDLASKKGKLHEMNSERTPLLEYVTLFKNSETRAAIRALDDNTAKLKAAQAVVNELQILISKSEAALNGVTVSSFRIDFDTKASRNSVLFYAIQTLVKTIDKMEVDLKDEKIKATSGMEAVAELEKAQAELAQLVKKSDQESRYPSSLDNHSGDTSDQGLSEMIRVANERVQTLREKIGM
jgi:phosphopantetheine adenylyltransferase